MGTQLTTITVFGNDGNAKHRNSIEISGTLDAGSLLEYCGYIARELGAMIGFLPVRADRGPNGSITISMSTDVERATAGPLVVSEDVLNQAGLVIGKQTQISVQAPKRMSLSGNDICLPVVAGQHGEGNQFMASASVIYGTAFPFANGGFFLTAGHVLRDASSDGVPALGKAVDGASLQAYRITDFEIIEGIDLGIFRCPAFQRTPPMSLDFSSALPIFSPVSALGFPFSIDPEYLTMVHRGFAGHVVAFRRFYQLSSQPFGYELSFLTPPGMSGAPLIADRDGSSSCYGYIIQQSSTTVRGERVDLGLAVSIDMILAVDSRVAGGPIAKLLHREPRPLPERALTWQEQADLQGDDLESGWPPDSD